MSQTNRIRTLIVGAGMTGLSVMRHLAERDHLTLIDTRSNVVPDSMREAYPHVRLLLGQRAQVAFDALGDVAAEFDRAVVSPGLEDDHWLLQHVRASGVPMCTDIDLLFAALDSTSPATVIGITGTNGKSTVTELTAALLNAVGVPAVAGGNLGPAALDLLLVGAQTLVLELSSFQLARSGPCAFDAATILNVQPDHIDYHGSMAAYVSAKQNIYQRARKVVFNRDDATTAPTEALEASNSQHCTFGLDAPQPGQVGVSILEGERWLTIAFESQRKHLLRADTLMLVGRHNEANVLSALALVLMVAPQSLAQSWEALAAVLRTYRGLPHRCERISDVAGVRYINDSKATNVGATVAAIEGLRSDAEEQLLLLLGGDGKGADFSALAAAVGEGVRGAFVYGAAAAELQEALQSRITTVRCDTLFTALTAAREMARPGDCVLLSPACASFDQFDNFEARGEAFRHYVQELAA